MKKLVTFLIFSTLLSCSVNEIQGCETDIELWFYSTTIDPYIEFQGTESEFSLYSPTVGQEYVIYHYFCDGTMSKKNYIH